LGRLVGRAPIVYLAIRSRELLRHYG